jgi:superfamily II DNA or RNA helicase
MVIVIHRQALLMTMTNTTLRPYQIKALDAVRAKYRAGVQSVLLVSPTGSGKTVMFSHVAQGRAARGGQTLILCHRMELIEQIEEALSRVGITAGIIAAGVEPTEASAQIASVQTLCRRLHKQTWQPDFIIVDEAHHAIATTQWGKVIAAFPQARVLGVTATPTRAAGEGLDALFQENGAGAERHGIDRDRCISSCGDLCPCRA